MRRLITAGALAFAAAGQAFGADLPEPAPPPQAPAAYIPAPPPVYNWGGVYFGINGGYGFGNSKWSNTLNPAGSTGTFKINGGLVGATVGANFQVDAFVFGLEGDIDASDIHGSNTGTFCPIACETKNTWLSTIRGRFGYAVDRVLFYGTAGGALGNIQSGVNGHFDNPTKAGWTAGVGLEAAFTDNWTARAEYLYVALQDGTCSTPGNCGIPAGDTVKFTTSLVRFGVDYKFR